jgi:hypothetical protein
VKWFLPLLILISFCVRRQSEKVTAGWVVVTEISQIPEAGGYHPFLWRKSSHVHVMVDTNTYSVTDLGDDCVAWYGLDSRGMFAACGDHEPLLLQRGPDMQTGIKLSGDQLSLGSFMTSVRATKDAARRQPMLSTKWQATTLRL